MKKVANVDDFIAGFPKDIQKLLAQMRAAIRKSAPAAVESISYGMPAYKLHGKPLVYFGAFQHHIGFYATPTGHHAFADDLSKYKQGKGSVQFPLDQPLPIGLVTEIVQFKVKELSK